MWKGMWKRKATVPTGKSANHGSRAEVEVRDIFLTVIDKR